MITNHCSNFGLSVKTAFCFQVEVIHVGACTLLRHGQGEAGLELALLFAKALSDTDPDGEKTKRATSV